MHLWLMCLYARILTMPNSTLISRPKVRNPATQARIRRDVWCQILIPIILIFGGLVTLGILAGWTVAGDTRSAIADTSLIMLMCPAAIVAVLALALVGGLCVGMIYVLRELPYLLKRVQDVMVLAVYYTQKYADRVSGVFVSTRSRLAAGQKTSQHIWALLDRRRPK